jgi:hypothetical protein
MNDQLKSQMVIRIASNFGFTFPRRDLTEFDIGDTMTVHVEVTGKEKVSFVPIIGMQVPSLDLRISAVELNGSTEGTEETLIVIQAKQSPPFGLTVLADEAQHQIWNMDRWIGSDIQTTALALYGSELMINQGVFFIPYKGKELVEYLKKL